LLLPPKVEQVVDGVVLKLGCGCLGLLTTLHSSEHHEHTPFTSQCQGHGPVLHSLYCPLKSWSKANYYFTHIVTVHLSPGWYRQCTRTRDPKSSVVVTTEKEVIQLSSWKLNFFTEISPHSPSKEVSCSLQGHENLAVKVTA
jgi:hypothetical protein